MSGSGVAYAIWRHKLRIFSARQLTVWLLAAILLVSCAQPEPDRQPGDHGPATRIIALTPHIAELVYGAGAGDRLVGVVEFSDWPAAALELQSVGNAFRIDYEMISVLQPDLVLAWQAGNPPEMIERLQGLGYRVVQLKSQGLDSVADDLELIGLLAGTSAVANEAAADIREQVRQLRSVSYGGDPVSVFWQISADPWFTVTGKHVINEIIETCGGRNIFVDAAGLAPAVSLEAIIAARPEAIIASMPPEDDGWKEAWQRWDAVPAVRDGHLYSVNPDYISRSGPRIVDGARQVCAALADARSAN